MLKKNLVAVIALTCFVSHGALGATCASEGVIPGAPCFTVEGTCKTVGVCKFANCDNECKCVFNGVCGMQPITCPEPCSNPYPNWTPHATRNYEHKTTVTQAPPMGCECTTTYEYRCKSGYPIRYDNWGQSYPTCCASCGTQSSVWVDFPEKKYQRRFMSNEQNSSTCACTPIYQYQCYEGYKNIAAVGAEYICVTECPTCPTQPTGWVREQDELYEKKLYIQLQDPDTCECKYYYESRCTTGAWGHPLLVTGSMEDQEKIFTTGEMASCTACPTVTYYHEGQAIDDAGWSYPGANSTVAGCFEFGCCPFVPYMDETGIYERATDCYYTP